jgi:chaperonin GroES
MSQTVTATQLRPLGDRVVVKPAAREETTRSGLVLPDTSTERPQRGEVLAVGPGRVTDEGTRLAMEVKVGDTVLFAKYAGTEFKLEDEELLILAERDVLAIVDA